MPPLIPAATTTTPAPISSWPQCDTPGATTATHSVLNHQISNEKLASKSAAPHPELAVLLLNHSSQPVDRFSKAYFSLSTSLHQKQVCTENFKRSFRASNDLGSPKKARRSWQSRDSGPPRNSLSEKVLWAPIGHQMQKLPKYPQNSKSKPVDRFIKAKCSLSTGLC